jgi:RNA polymerase sigma factor (sigma-70 family)
VAVDTGDLPARATATRRLFDEYGAMVLAVCRARLRDRHEAEDAAQQTFLAAHRSLLCGREPRYPAAWLATIARNECGMRARRRPPAPVPPDAVPAAPIDPEDVLAARAELEALTAAVASLPPRQREALLLHELRGLSYAETAAVLGVTPRVVDALVYRARRRVAAVERIGRAVIALPGVLREALGRDCAETAGAVAAGGTAGVGLTKLAATPLAAKVAVATLGLGAAAPVVASHVQHPGPRSTPSVAEARTQASVGREWPAAERQRGGDSRRGSGGRESHGRGSREPSHEPATTGEGGWSGPGPAPERGEGTETTTAEGSSSGPGPGAAETTTTAAPTSTSTTTTSMTTSSSEGPGDGSSAVEVSGNDGRGGGGADGGGDSGGGTSGESH